MWKARQARGKLCSLRNIDRGRRGWMPRVSRMRQTAVAREHEGASHSGRSSASNVRSGMRRGRILPAVDLCTHRAHFTSISSDIAHSYQVPAPS